MRRRTRLFILASAGVLALGVHIWRSPGAQRRRAPAAKATALEAALAEIEAGRKTTPLIGEPTAAGLITEATVESRVLRGSWRVIVYTPSGYRDDGNHPVAVFLDLRSGQVSRVLDWLIAHQAIEPIVAVFVRPTSRGSDYPAGAAACGRRSPIPAIPWSTPRCPGATVL